MIGTDGKKKYGKEIKSKFNPGLPKIPNTAKLEKDIKKAPPGLEWERYRYCKEMADFWLVQAGHAYTNLPVEGLRAKGGFWARKVGRKDIAYYAGHIAQFIPGAAKRLAKSIKPPI